MIKKRKSHLSIRIWNFSRPIGTLSGTGNDGHHLAPVFWRDLHLVWSSKWCGFFVKYCPWIFINHIIGMDCLSSKTYSSRLKISKKSDKEGNVNCQPCMSNNTFKKNIYTNWKEKYDLAAFFIESKIDVFCCYFSLKVDKELTKNLRTFSSKSDTHLKLC